MSGQRSDDQDRVGGGQSLETYVGKEVDVVLAELPGAGYEWVPREVPAGLRSVSAQWAEPPPPEPGASRRRMFRFAADEAGSYDLIFELVRHWEGTDVAPARQHRVSVVVHPRAGSPTRGSAP